MAVDAGLIAAGAAKLGPRDAGFLQRVYGGGLTKYADRLAAIGFRGLGKVLDAGCGFGQWGLALAETCGEVVGIDTDAQRIAVAGTLAARQRNACFMVAPLTEMPFPDASFDGVFCYSAIYYTDIARSVKEIARVLKPGGVVYISSNGLGWYLFNIVKAPNPSPDFNPRAYGALTLIDTVRYRLFGTPPSRSGSVVTPIRYLANLLKSSGIDLVACGPEGSIHADPAAPRPKPFFRGRFAGFEGTSEWLGKKAA